LQGLFLQVFCDNYLDGGYHVPYAHKGLASGLKMDSYSITVRFFTVFKKKSFHFTCYCTVA